MAVTTKPSHGLFKSGFSEGIKVTPECELSCEGEDDLERLHSDCKKNPGHESFIPVPDFNMSHLPPEHQTKETLETIKMISDLTVKINIKFTSLERPSVYSDINAPYPYAKYKGSKRVRRYGTGLVRNFDSDGKESYFQGECPCHECKGSDSPKMEYWTLHVCTATHVIFDDSEAARSTYECFFDSEDRKGVKTLYGISLLPRKLDFDKYESDSCYVNCVTHDKELWNQLNELCCKFNFMFFTGNCTPTFAFLVSHPHGCSKKITLGNITHYTIPVDEEYPINVPIMFENHTVCRLPLLPWFKEASSESHNEAEKKLEGIPSSSCSNVNFCCAEKLQQSDLEKSHIKHEDKEDKEAAEDNAKTSHDVTANETNQESNDNVSGNLREWNPAVLLSGQDLISVMSSLPQETGSGLPSHNEASQTRSNFEGDLGTASKSESESKENAEQSEEGNPASVDSDILHDLFRQMLQSLPPGLTVKLPPELEYALFSAKSHSQLSFEPGKEFLLPSGTNFILPPGAKYALRFASLKPAWYILPTGTEAALPNGETILLPPGAEFLSQGLSVRFIYITYDMDTCPGSSGAIIHQIGGGMWGEMGLPFSVHHYSHFGSLDLEGRNRSGLQCLYLVLT